MLPGELFQRPTSVILCGSQGPLLDWVVFALASRAPGGYFWTDVRLEGQPADTIGPLGRRAIPEDHLSVLSPQELTTNDALANAAITGGLRPEERLSEIERVSDFLRLPSHTQALIAAQRTSGAPAVLVLSNAQRLAALYPPTTISPVLRAMVAADVSVVLVFADAPPRARVEFDNVWHLDSAELSRWRDAVLRIEKANTRPPLTAGKGVPLRDLPAVAETLQGVTDPRPAAGR